MRSERPDDSDAIDAVHASAFDDPKVVRLVRDIRASDGYVPNFALVGVIAGEVVGHIMLSRAYVDQEAVLVLSPLGVAKPHQRRGIGLAITAEALRRADAAGEPLIVVTGVPSYYPRFGFERAGALGFTLAGETIDQPWWMALPLSTFDPQRHIGDVRWTEPFLALQP